MPLIRTIKKWLKPDKHVNYTDQILRSVIKTSYAKKKLSSLLLMFITIIVRLICDFILGYIINFNNIYIDFWIQILISIILVLKSSWLYQIVERFDRDIYLLTKFLVNNYTDENYRKWKRNITLIFCFILIIYLHFTQLTNNILTLYVFQYLICYMAIDLIENGYKNFKSPYYGPIKKATYIYDDNFKLAEDQSIAELDKKDNVITLPEPLSITLPSNTLINNDSNVHYENFDDKSNLIAITPPYKPPEENKRQRSLSQSGYIYDDDVFLDDILNDNLIN